MITFKERTELLNQFLKECYPDGIQIFGLERKVRRKPIFPAIQNKLNETQMKHLFHLSRNLEVVFEPVKYSCIYFDDPEVEKLSEISYSYWIAITSPGKAQIHIPIPTGLRKAYEDIRARKLLQRCFCEFFKTENVAAWNHTRKLPFTQNNKYNPPTIIHLEKRNPEKKNIDDFLRLLEKIEPLWKEFYDQYFIPEPQEKHEPDRTTRHKIWIDFYDGDESQADIRYAVYLFSRGYSWEEVEQALLQESHNIHVRKKGHLQDYLNRTLRKAWDYSRKTWKPPKRLEE